MNHTHALQIYNHSMPTIQCASHELTKNNIKKLNNKFHKKVNPSKEKKSNTIRSVAEINQKEKQKSMAMIDA